MSTKNEYIVPSTRWQTVIGTLPFLGFGIMSMVGKLDRYHNPQMIYIYLAFYALALGGLLIGWLREFPLWSYGYLGYSLIFAWIWLNGKFNGIYWGNRSWVIFGIIVLIALLWTRSLDPIKKLFSNISCDWSRLSLAMYTFIAFVFLIYDENHHPYLLIFMAMATLAITAGTWFFLQSAHLKSRILSILGGLVAGYLIGTICDRTWDAAAYYDLPKGPPDPWFMTLYRTFMILAFFAAILFWPALIALFQRINSQRTTS